MATLAEKILSLFKQSPEAAAKAIANTADMGQLAENLDTASKEVGNNAPDRLIPHSEIETAVKESVTKAVKGVKLKEVDPEMAKLIGELLTMMNSVSVDVYGYAYKEVATKEQRDPLFVSAEKYAELEKAVKEQADTIAKQQAQLKELGANVPAGLAGLFNGYRASQSQAEGTVSKENSTVDMETAIKQAAAKQIENINRFIIG